MTDLIVFSKSFFIIIIILENTKLDTILPK